MEYQSRQFMIFNVSELDQIDFTQVLETSPDTIRKSVDGTLTFIKYKDEEMPSSIVALETKVSTFNAVAGDSFRFTKVNSSDWAYEKIQTIKKLNQQKN